MTTPLMPDFIADMFNDEIRRIQEELIDRICREFKLEKAVVMKKMGFDGPCIKFSGMRFKILKYYDTPYGSKKQTDKCIARIHNASENTLHQCKKSKSCGEFCMTHFDKKESTGLNWGTIHDPVPENVKNSQSTKIY